MHQGASFTLDVVEYIIINKVLGGGKYEQKTKKLIIVALIILSVLSLERIYNNRNEFQVTAKDASYYGIVEANLTTREKLQDFDYLYDVLKINYPFFKGYRVNTSKNIVGKINVI